MTATRILVIIISIMISFGICNGQSKDSDTTTTTITTKELTQWTLLGMGEVSTWGDQLALKEADNTKGVMLVSPDSYGDNVIVRYKALALTPATVMVVVLSLSDEGKTTELTIPDNYDGNMGLLSNDKENYFYAFKNAPHNLTPFVRRYTNAKIDLASASENTMIAGVYYQIEVGRRGAKLWLSIDGVKIIEADDETPLSGGHIAIRLRGTAGFVAGCLIKDMKISTKN